MEQLWYIMKTQVLSHQAGVRGKIRPEAKTSLQTDTGSLLCVCRLQVNQALLCKNAFKMGSCNLQMARPDGYSIDSPDGERNLNLQTGFVGDNEDRMLSDTGCELVAVQRDLVSKDQMLDKRFVMITIHDQAKTIPTAFIEIDTPYYRGSLEAMVLSQFLCGLVLGTIGF